jgi:putative ATPase
MDLFDHALQERMKTEAPLAARMRPRTLDEFVVQEEALQATSVGPGKLLRRAIEADRRFWREALKRRA